MVMREIREVEKEDILDIVDIEINSLTLVYEDESIELEKERMIKYLKKFFEKDRMILVEDEERVLGFLHSRSYQDSISDKKIREILTITIHPDHYGEDLGKELMEFEREDAKSSNVDILKLEVLSSNDRAIDFYKKQGFDEKKKIMTDEISREN